MSDQTVSDDRKFGWRAIGLIVIFVTLVTGLSALLSDGTPADILGRALAAFILSILGILSYRYPAVHDALEKFFSSAIRFFVWTFVTLLPLVFFNWLLSIVLTTLSLGFQIAVFAAWGILLAFAIQAIVTPGRRDRLFGTGDEPVSRFAKRRKSKKDRGLSGLIGNPTPVVYALDLLLIATIFFSTITFVLAERGVVQLNGFPESTPRVDPILGLYIWHFFETIPLLKVNDTLQWKQPLTYQAGLLGVIVLLFKLSVILPVTAAFSWYWKQITETDEAKVESNSNHGAYRRQRSPMSSPVTSSARAIKPGSNLTGRHESRQ